MALKIDPKQFKANKFYTAEEKANTLQKTIAFIENGFPKTQFIAKIYKLFHLHCGHIAHYNIHGFYEEWFLTPETQRDFIKSLLDYPNWGDDWKDGVAWLQSWLRQQNTLQKLELAAQNYRTAQDTAAYLALQKKLGLTPTTSPTTTMHAGAPAQPACVMPIPTPLSIAAEESSGSARSAEQPKSTITIAPATPPRAKKNKTSENQLSLF